MLLRNFRFKLTDRRSYLKIRFQCRHTSEICRTVTTSLHSFRAVNCQLFAVVQLLDRARSTRFVQVQLVLQKSQRHDADSLGDNTSNRRNRVNGIHLSFTVGVYNFRRFVRVCSAFVYGRRRRGLKIRLTRA